jgi:hypothetical protein
VNEEPKKRPEVQDGNPLLSEFDALGLTQFFNLPLWGWILAFVVVLGAIGVLWLAKRSGAIAFNRQIQPTMHLADGKDQPLSPINLIGGYLAQANHGFFYLIVAPVFAMIAARFLAVTYESFRNLVKLGRLPPAALDWARQKNLACFRLLWWIPFIVVWIGILCFTEFRSLRHVEAGSSHITGYVQAGYLPNWTNWFMTATNQWELLGQDSESQSIPREIRSCLQAAPLETVVLWETNQCLEFKGPLKPDRELLPGLVSRGEFDIDLGRACSTNTGLVKFDVKLSNYPKSKGWQNAFIVGVQVLEGGFQVFATWIALKAAFWVLLVWCLLPGKDGWMTRFVRRMLPGLHSKDRLEPLLTDPRKHFGLYDLHAAYNGLILLLAMGAFSLTLVSISGKPHSTSDDYTATLHGFLSPFLIAVVVAVPGLILASGPVALFNWRLRNLRNQRLLDLNRQQRELQFTGKPTENSPAKPESIDKTQTHEEMLTKLEQMKILVEEQTCWPQDDSTFKFLGAATIIFAVLPLCLHFGYAPKQVEEYLSVVRFCDSEAKSVTDSIFHVTTQIQVASPTRPTQ